MSTEEKIKKELIQRFGDAYKAFGLNKLMGHIIALLLFSPEPLSLDDITKQLGRSKGPISQIVRRLRDKRLIRKAWMPENNRKDYYEIEPEVFEHAFRNNLELIKNNKRIATQLKEKIKSANKASLATINTRMKEMELFYSLMEEHYNAFLNEWSKERAKLYK
ncbi:Putative transcriptional regulator [Ignavibacterium album JCM 16511]|jgi:DNA-binding transcriptional regulator GbsR (MarR family)|uniref:HTH-type transcriptional regulator n=1 Tax=Ignavibacterium album (strain DSM 19864 / JCM 16511 / NBRC 101810 / Mat9-16) TaxID=945713 RepID=I0AGP5_IGNAJ|nr:MULTISPECIES: MarR family transcriptional regulator [Ignavibacterium]AFH48152.1 Putative transcriptional regulator [Ignavibacterium album JCM 16511]BDQ03911.1 MAG: transcriptional regulator [Ignavibacterium sp.]GIV45730.1 MAG: transcriptional regulator [Ignavibacterium sp.]